MAETLLFIFNPHSGKAQIGNELVTIIDIFTKGGYDVVAHPTQAPRDAYQTILAYGDEYKTVVVSGGDGTLSEAVEGLMSLDNRDSIRLGYIPSGSTNDFAASLGIPSDMEEAARRIVRGKTFKCDIGKFNDTKFNYVAAFGAFTDVAYATPQESKNMLGHMAYIIEGIQRLPKLQSYAMNVTCDGRKISGEFILGMVMNSNQIGGIKGESIINADLSDGLFELLLIKAPANILEMQPVIAGILRGDKEGDGFCILKGKEFTFETEDDVQWTLDGEYGGNSRQVSVSVLEKAVNFII